jgi:hypothetical protein
VGLMMLGVPSIVAPPGDAFQIGEMLQTIGWL